MSCPISYFSFIYLLTYFFSQNVYFAPTTCSALYNVSSVLPGHVPAPTSSVIPSTLFVYLLFIFIYLLIFFSFLECLSCPYYAFSSVQCLVYALWTYPFPHCLTHDVLPLSRAVTNSLYNHYHCIYKFLTLYYSLIVRRLSTLNFQLLSVGYIFADLILLS